METLIKTILLIFIGASIGFILGWFIPLVWLGVWVPIQTLFVFMGIGVLWSVVYYRQC